ncbi:hypothetical protein CMK14_28405 [Candidatus Poribacteria bacterium]|nr:hypothetical protein [Candidatus Poribacteria bacterium]
MIGPNHQQVLVSIVEKKSKFMVMTKVENKTAALVATATIELLGPDKDHILTITADGGKEFAPHEKVTKALACDYIFCSARFLLVARAEPEHQ